MGHIGQRVYEIWLGFLFRKLFREISWKWIQRKNTKTIRKIFFRKSVREKKSAKTMVLLLQQLIAQKPVGIYYSAKLEVFFLYFNKCLMTNFIFFSTKKIIAKFCEKRKVSHFAERTKYQIFGISIILTVLYQFFETGKSNRTIIGRC